MATLTTTSAPPVAAAHDPEAAARVEAYLRAHRVDAKHRAELVGLILEAASRRQASEPGRPLLTLAVEVAEMLIDGWIRQLVQVNLDEPPERRIAHGRAAVHIAGLPRKWPGYFLDRGAPPPELVERLRAAYLEAGPDMELSSMVPRAIDLGRVSAVADETWKTFDKWPFLRGLIIWGLFGLLLGSVFYLVRY